MVEGIRRLAEAPPDPPADLQHFLSARPLASGMLPLEPVAHSHVHRVSHGLAGQM
jgi:hypothetical protein